MLKVLINLLDLFTESLPARIRSKYVFYALGLAAVLIAGVLIILTLTSGALAQPETSLSIRLVWIVLLGIVFLTGLGLLALGKWAGDI